jgi:hypothetical protein
VNSNPKWVVRDKPRLLLALMEELAGNAHISFEGDLRHFNLNKFAGASENETAVLKRNTLWPTQEFVVIPLAPSMGQQVLAAISRAVPWRIIHIQIERDGVLQFAAYDSFHAECLVWGPALKTEFFESLVKQGVLEARRTKT